MDDYEIKFKPKPITTVAVLAPHIQKRASFDFNEHIKVAKGAGTLVKEQEQLSKRETKLKIMADEAVLTELL